jgi:hypothetical protein
MKKELERDLISSSSALTYLFASLLLEKDEIEGKSELEEDIKNLISKLNNLIKEGK